MAITSSHQRVPRLRVAVLGCGTLARQVLLPLLAHIPSVQIVVIADPDTAALDASVRFAPEARGLADWRDAVESDADAVVVALPTALHAQAAMAVLDARKHLYLEKPIAATVEEGIKIHNVSGVVARVGFNYRFNPLVVELRRRIAAGAIGAVAEMRTTFSTRAVPGGWRRFDAQGGGVLLDLGSHHVDLARYLTGDEIASVSAQRDVRGDGEEVTLEMQSAKGMLVQSTFATGTRDEDRIEVTGVKGTLRVDRYSAWTVAESLVQPLPAGKRFVRALRQAPAAMAFAMAKQRSPWHEPSFELSLRDFVDACAGGTSYGATLDDGLRSLMIVDAARRSAAEGRTIVLEHLAPEPARVG